jgi:uncharacterized protein YcfJ
MSNRSYFASCEAVKQQQNTKRSRNRAAAGAVPGGVLGNNLEGGKGAMALF